MSDASQAAAMYAAECTKLRSELAEVKSEISTAKELFNLHNLLPFLSECKCQCDASVGMAPCEPCAAREILRKASALASAAAQPVSTDINVGVWFQSAVSGLWYTNRKAAGDVSTVKVDGKSFEIQNPNKPMEYPGMDSDDE